MSKCLKALCGCFSGLCDKLKSSRTALQDGHEVCETQKTNIVQNVMGTFECYYR